MDVKRTPLELLLKVLAVDGAVEAQMAKCSQQNRPLRLRLRLRLRRLRLSLRWTRMGSSCRRVSGRGICSRNNNKSSREVVAEGVVEIREVQEVQRC